MLIQKLRQPVLHDFEAVNKLIVSSLSSSVDEITQIGHHLVNNGGKRLRPLVVLLCARALNISNEQHITMAAVIEFIHTATLLHDDVVDKSQQRRGNQTANYIWGNHTAVLTGDFLYSRAFQMMLETPHQPVLKIIADATNVIAEGEVLQQTHQRNIHISEKDYFHILHCKTAKLFEAAAELSAALTTNTPEHRSILAQYGYHLGMLYQIIDDLLDYTAPCAEFGKNIGDDLAEGKPTLPLIYLLEHGTQPQKRLVQEALTKTNPHTFPKIQATLKNSDAFDYTRATAAQHAVAAKQLLHELPASVYQQHAALLVDFALNRSF